MNSTATGGLKPDLTILLDIDPDEGLSRVPAKRIAWRSEPRYFHKRVRDGYLEIASGEPERFLVLDATLDEETSTPVSGSACPRYRDCPCQISSQRSGSCGETNSL